VESLKGSLLLAGGGLLDLNFRQTVILIVEHSEEGAIGVVLNRDASTPLAEAVPSLASLPKASGELFIGGPVAPQNVLVIAQYEHPETANSIIFGDVGVYSAAEKPPVDPIVLRARVFAGYAGWGPGQLEAEMAAGGWISTPALTEDVFSAEPGELWREVLRRLGPDYDMLRQMPFDPSLN
jgi:putative transcriptional regulator